jgi:hypothetical protein
MCCWQRGALDCHRSLAVSSWADCMEHKSCRTQHLLTYIATGSMKLPLFDSHMRSQKYSCLTAFSLSKAAVRAILYYSYWQLSTCCCQAARPAHTARFVHVLVHTEAYNSSSSIQQVMSKLFRAAKHNCLLEAPDGNSCTSMFLVLW